MIETDKLKEEIKKSLELADFYRESDKDYTIYTLFHTIDLLVDYVEILNFECFSLQLERKGK